MKSLIRKLVREEVKNYSNQKKRLNESRIRTNEYFVLDLHTGKFLKRCVNMVANSVQKQIGRQADITFKREPTALLGSAFAVMSGYNRSDIQVTVDVSASYYDDKLHFTVKIDSPMGSPDAKREWEVRARNNPEDVLNSIANHIVGVAFGYQNS